jgi:hypothetical protein
MHYYLSEGEALLLTLDGVFMNARFRAHQIIRRTEFPGTGLHIPLSDRCAARAFDIGHSAATRVKLREYDMPIGRA